MAHHDAVSFLPGVAGDRALVARLAAGEDDAYRECYQTHSPALMRLLVRVLRNRALAEEIVQDTLLAALREQGGAGRIRVVCPPGAVAPGPGLEVRDVDRERLRSDPGGLGAEAAALRAFAPDLAVHADPDPDWVGEVLAGAAQAAGSLAFRPAPERPADPLQPVFPPPAHNLLLEPEPAWGAGLCRALGLTVPAALEA